MCIVLALTGGCLPGWHSLEGRDCAQSSECGEGLACGDGRCRVPSRETYGEMLLPRTVHTAPLLGDGSVLLVGGRQQVGVTATAERFEAVSRRFRPAGTMVAARRLHAAVRLLDGRVLVAGGYTGGVPE